MFHMMLLPMADTRNRDQKISGPVSYDMDHIVDVPGRVVKDEFREMAAGLIRRLATEKVLMKMPSASKHRLCPIRSE